MSDIQSVVDRIYRDFLQPPGEQPSRFTLDTGGAEVALSASSSSDDILIDAGHGLSNGEQIQFTALTGGAGLDTFTRYYVISATTGTFQLSLTSGGSAINFTTDISAATYVKIDSLSAAGTLVWVDTSLLAPEEEDLIAEGTLLEIESELVLVTAISGTSPNFELTLRRGMYDTTAAAHAADVFVYLADGDYIPRHSVFTAVADAVESLWPDLWTVGVEETFADSQAIELPAVAGEILDMLVQDGARWRREGSWDEFQDFPLSSTGNAVQVAGVPNNSSIQVYYKKKTTRPTTEADLLATLGVESGWVKLLVLQAVAQLVSRADLSKATVDFITQALEAEAGGPIGAGADIRNALVQFAEFQLQPLKRQLQLKQHDRLIIEAY